MCREVVHERHGVVARGVVHAEEQRDFTRRFNIRQVIAEFLEVSLVKFVPAVRIMAKPGPEAGARTSTLARSFVSPRGQMRSTSTLVPPEASGGS